ncbi:MAG: carboxypeptidase regulatory-like domain-containing protein [Gemmatimonadaceae bacterium]|nr:carboxypeptidase regulatory-like domain-containing protein [Gemmatimonadaceae bacterium]
MSSRTPGRAIRAAVSAVVTAMLGALSPIATTPLHAQATEGYVSGLVRTADGGPVADATITARNDATGFQEVRRTDARGRFVFAQLPIGGPYVITARKLGLQAERRSGITLNLGDRVALDFTLKAAAQELSAIDVRGDRENKRAERVGASFVVDQEKIQELPIADRSFADLSIIAPTTSRAGTGGIITSSSSIAGGRVSSTDIRVDGVQMKNTIWGTGFGRGPYSMSVEAIREFEIVTNVYDVTQGRQGAGAVNVATLSGTNKTTGSLFGYNRNQALTTNTNFLGQPIVDFTNWQWGGSISGPIIKDKLHYVVAYDRQDVNEPFFALDVANQADWSRLQVAPDSINRFLDILRRQYGLPQGQQNGRFDRSNALNTLFARADWTINDRNRLTVRHNFSNWFYGNSIPDRDLSVLESRGNQRSQENQFLTTLKSSIGTTGTNDFRIAYTNRILENEPNTRLPRAWVTVASALPDGRTGAPQILQFGGQRTSPELQTEESIQLVNITRFERGNTAWTFGTDNSLNNLSMFVSIETDGLFQFPNLGALEARRPSSYARLVPIQELEPRMRQRVFDGGAFAQAEYRPRESLTLAGGLRYDVTAFLTAANRNPTVEQVFGKRTDERPFSAQFQPRGQVTWNVGARGTDILRVGGGLFTAAPHYMAHINHLLNDGSQLADVLLTGAAVPTPDFMAYRQNFASTPGIPAGSAARPAYINLFAEDYRVPQTWKADASYQRRFFDGRLSLGVTGQYADTRNNYRYFDLNLPQEPSFRLANEANRPVFVSPSVITNPALAGVAGRVVARPFSQFQRVLEFRSDAAQVQRAAIFEGNLILPRGANLGGSFTLNSTRDNNSFNCCIAITSVFTPVQGDPRDLSWGPSNTDFRHKFVLFGSTPEFFGGRLSFRAIGQSGSPWSATVAQDINYDDVGVGGSFGNQNDLAFLFNPGTAGLDPTFATGLRGVLDNPNNLAREYLRDNLGTIAGRNAIRNPFVTQIDVRYAQRLPLVRGQSAEFTIDVFNFASMLNHAWGGVRVVPGANQTLLRVTGFDAATSTYRYAVNPTFGQSVLAGNRYQIQAGMRYRF